MMVGTFSWGINNFSIRLGSFLPLELHSMGCKLEFGFDGWK